MTKVVIKVSVSEAEKQKFEAAAQHEGLSLSSWARTHLKRKTDCKEPKRLKNGEAS
jgi:hypothetical protein